MALTRKQWNNVIIAASVFMVATLSLLQHKTADMPDSASPLFDDNAPLKQLQLDGVWLQSDQGHWQCDPQVLNCNAWGDAWRNIRVSALSDTPTTTETPLELVLQINKINESQVWLYFPQQGLLKSSSGNWYQIPPSLRHTLQPVIDASPSSAKP